MEPIQCTMSTIEAAGQVVEWSKLGARSSHEVDDGVEFAFPVERLADLQELVRRESACCAFLDLKLVADDHGATLTITSPDPDARPVIEALSAVIGG